MNNSLQPPLEIWGGVEGTFNRVGNRYFNQLEWSGHAHRADDLDLFAEIGLKAIRYPVIWESLAPNHPEEIDWTFPDERLNRLRELNIRPIAGLVHHGSGPRYAHITSPDFAPALANYARRIAQRYPWLDAYTPVNEPVTTARFCGLYGLWHPHGRDNPTFTRILLNQCRAISESMFAIREVNPNAQLIQTDDAGRIYSTRKLNYQAEFENHRRWLGFDLVCGRVDRNHIMWDFLVETGATPKELDWFCEHPCPPDVIGIDYYPTSDRFLDHNYHRYPGRSHAGNGRDSYVDIEAIRVLPAPISGFKERSIETWKRYGLPLVIGEAHLGCSREEQVRWLASAWRAAQELRDEGVPMLAVTAWALLGVWNWNSLVTRDDNHYESGVFDTRGPYPRPTAVAHLIRDLANGREKLHPIAHQRGWWERQSRIIGAPLESLMLPHPSPDEREVDFGENVSGNLLILGKDEALGQAFARACDERGLPYFLLSAQDINIDDELSIESALDSTNPWAVINAFGDEGLGQNASGAEVVKLAELCAQREIGLVCFIAEQESSVLEAHPAALVVRLGYSSEAWSGDRTNIVASTLDLLVDGVNGIWSYKEHEMELSPCEECIPV